MICLLIFLKLSLEPVHLVFIDFANSTASLRCCSDYAVFLANGIKCKSKDLQTRYVLFLFTQLLQANWMCFFKEEVSFKAFIIELEAFAKRINGLS